MAKHLALRWLVSGNATTIRGGQCRGLVLPRSIAMQNLSMVLGKYEPTTQRLLSGLCENCSVAYDIGAHVGFFSLLMAHHMSEGAVVHAFEPSPGEAEKIRELATGNHLENTIHVHALAVSDRIGEVKFYPGDGPFTGILDSACKPRMRENRATVIQVESITLDEFTFAQQRPLPHLVKVDVESAEASVMRGARRMLAEARPKMLIEVHGPDACRETIEEIAAHDYRIQWCGSGEMEDVKQADQFRARFSKHSWTGHLLAIPR